LGLECVENTEEEGLLPILQLEWAMGLTHSQTLQELSGWMKISLGSELLERHELLED
jgi:hypothetical protein